MSEPTKRPRLFRYSLQTLLLVVIVLAALVTAGIVWYDSHIAWIQGRSKARSFVKKSNRWGMVQSSDTTRLPLSLQLLGESHVVERFYIYEESFQFGDSSQTKELKELKMLFPEAIVEVRRSK